MTILDNLHRHNINYHCHLQTSLHSTYQIVILLSSPSINTRSIVLLSHLVVKPCNVPYQFPRVGASHSISASPELTEPQPIAQPHSLDQDKTPGLKQVQPPAEASHQRIYLQ